MKTERLKPGDRFGSLTILEYVKNDCYKAQCDCGNISYPTKHNLLTGHTRSCGNCGKNSYRLCDDGATVELISTNGYKILIDAEDEEKVRGYKWHVTKDQKGNLSVMSSNRVYLHQLLLGFPEGEVDHINLNRLDNRKKNLRAVTHQQNQINQPLQKNNTSGVSGVSYYPPRKKYRARIKIGQHDIHLGYYHSFEEAVQARNVGMECMFGEYGRYNDVPPAPDWIRKIVVEKCKRFAELSVCRAFLLSLDEEVA